ncbi:MAG: hypothetical protein JSS51_13615 [Planctomycetes bacterium]|nr:hypothetical protein [Planctomycetota bacterium]
MRRPGTDENNVQMSDVLCDFCRQEWTDARFMVEGHQGSCICSDCLTHAYRAVARKSEPAVTEPGKCILCLETRPAPLWASPGFPDVLACQRCIKQSAAVLQKDPDFGWRKPER